MHPQSPFLIPLLATVLAGASNAQSEAVLPGDQATTVSAGSQERPSIARGAQQSLVVWEDNRTSLAGYVKPPNGLHANRDIYAMRLDDSGAPIGAAPVVVNDDTWDQLDPHVAWNGENYLVVWESTRTTQFFYSGGIYAARVSPNGKVLDDPPIVIEDSSDFDERSPRVASDGTNWLVVYNDYAGGASETLDGVLVHPQGFVMQKQTLIPGGQFQQAVNPDLEFATDRFLAVYERGYHGSYGQFFDTTLNPIGSEITFSTTASKPEVASNGAGFFVSMSSGRGTPVDLAGNVAIPGGASYLGTGTSWGPETECGWDGTNWTLAFSDIGFSGQPDDQLYLSQVDPSGVLVPGSPILVASTPKAIREFCVGNGPGASHVVWNDWSTSAATYQGGDLGDLWSRSVNSDGTLGVVEPATRSAAAQVAPVVSGNRIDGFLVAFLRLESGVTEVCGQRIDGNGQAIDPKPKVFARGDRRIRYLDAAFDGREWLVVWDDDAGTNRFTYGRRMHKDGTFLDATARPMLRGERPSVAALDGAGTFLIASWDHNQSTEYIRAMRVDGVTGQLLDLPYLTVAIGSGFPDVLGFDDRWAVVWGGVTAAFVHSAGTVGTKFFLASGLSETVHGLARNGDDAMVAFQRHSSTSANADIHVRRFRKDGTLLGAPEGIPVCQAANLQFDPRLAFDGSDFIASWTDYSVHPLLVPGLGDVRRAKIDPQGQVATLCGLPVFDDASRPEGAADLDAAGGMLVLAASTHHAEVPYGALRIEVHTNLSPTVGTAFCFGDGTGIPCPCGNPGLAGQGCANSTGVGAALDARGSASVTANSLVFTGLDLPPGTPALLFQGDGTTPGGGLPFGDGLRCVGGGIRRLGLRASDPTGSATWGPGLAGLGAWSAGSTQYFQVWYRDPSGPCAVGFNLSHGVEVSFLP